jgi:D-xylose transport system substrate-binding protein
MAVDFVKGTAPKFNTKLNNGKKDVDTVLLTPTLLTKDNLDSTVVKDGFYTHQQIFGK